jgi:tripeptide aminopeptidase
MTASLLIEQRARHCARHSHLPELKKYIGQEIIFTDGNTLLGADDKAGVASIMALVETLMKNPSIPHGPLKIGFTPDEEVGRGADHFDVQKFGADFAYTVDGGELGELEYETFNAAQAVVTFHGKNVHPGSAKDKMINSMLIAMEFNAMFPPTNVPSTPPVTRATSTRCASWETSKNPDDLHRPRPQPRCF